MLVSDRPETSGFFHSRSNSATSISHQSSPSQSPRLGSSRLLSNDLYLDNQHSKPFSSSNFLGFFRDHQQRQLNRVVKRKGGRECYQRKRVKGLVAVIGLVGSFFLVIWFMLLRLQDHRIADLQNYSSQNYYPPILVSNKEKWRKLSKGKRLQKGTYGRMLALAAHALAENKREPKDLWQEPFAEASAWIPCADQRNWDPSGGNNGYIMVTANGGINQQRVAVCNAVVVARLLNSTLVVPKFMYSSVWRDMSQFSDIYQEEHFINYLTPDIRIVKELPEDLQSLDLEAIGSVVTDVDIRKESKPRFYLKNILPILLKNRVVHFIGFGNRLAFDPIPFQLQVAQTCISSWTIGSLSCWSIHKIKCERKRGSCWKSFKISSFTSEVEIDMVAHSLCEYGGGEEERKVLEAYRAIHFPALALIEKTKRLPSPSVLRSEGLCPLTPEEAVLMLAALGFNRKTHIFVAGANIYGGQPRLAALTSLYPNLVTKEKLLSATELEPFLNFSSQLAALDFIACTAADAFAMTDSGSQLSSLVAGYRTYYGEGECRQYGQTSGDLRPYS
ncbi:hypothetical protein GH714_000368 [Hevea brasiliensis]|uniref:O-fucosyltransferase family protein n=1 Tax=Hevea brasiliensis TaxID=3981 RepID=A0A6A6M5Y2_HEVBR|nr:hypothetical protein GH714_000368 [Hevea brasiliensis]